jgi:hypothetical protein
MFAVALGVGVVVIAWPLVARFNKTTRRVALGLGLLASVAVGVPMLLAPKGDIATRASTLVSGYAAAEQDEKDIPVLAPPMGGPVGGSQGLQLAAMNGNYAQQLAHGGMLDGVRPVALTMPAYAHTAYASRQLVTPTRTFMPVVYYMTDAGFALLGLAWLMCAAGLAWSHKDKLRALRDKMQAALATKPVLPAVEPVAPAPAE